MSLKTQRKQLQQLLNEVLDAAPDGETRNRQRPVTQKIFNYFKELKSQVKVTPEELEAEKKKLGALNAELSDARAALEKQKDANATMSAKEEAMRLVIGQLRSCIRLSGVATVTNALKTAQTLFHHEEFSRRYESASQENMFIMALAETYNSDDFQRWFHEFGTNVYTSLGEGTITNDVPDFATIYKNKLNGA